MFSSHFLVNISIAIDKVVSMLFSKCWSNADKYTLTHFSFSTNYNVETTLGHPRWIDVILSMLFQRWFVYVETTSINIRRLNFHIQPNFNVKTTLVHRRWIDVNISMLFQLCFTNFETTSINVRRLSFHSQPNMNVETTSINVDDQRWCVCWVSVTFHI